MRLRGSPRNPDSRMILFTPIEGGMNDYISKPINFEALVKALETASEELVKS